MKLNELVCPACGLRCFVDTPHTTCASCLTFFHASQSRSVDSPAPLPASPSIPPIIPTVMRPPNIVPNNPSVTGPGLIEPPFNPNVTITWATSNDMPPTTAITSEATG